MNCLNCAQNCDDHGLLDLYVYIYIYIYICVCVCVCVCVKLDVRKAALNT